MFPPFMPNVAVEPRASQIRKCKAFIDREAQSVPTPLIAGARATARKGFGAALGSTATIARIVSGASGPRYRKAHPERATGARSGAATG